MTVLTMTIEDLMSVLDDLACRDLSRREIDDLKNLVCKINELVKEEWLDEKYVWGQKK